ncbi:S1C family serine protease [Clostridium aminobutyricum]|uniref:Trypsin-like peptidase domain-containing protein n=1 Tax=Clostridium aminobutyricum TaxID=33953 RepID=A0A939IK11_CLOAM|nr:trypsin-like peptidase domain-containing protein [Clostridium aminobutyricum]MBN7774119.1 trypsin-like peptidase domain-containing protein [Clostridium aminobutyricum]
MDDFRNDYGKDLDESFSGRYSNQNVNFVLVDPQAQTAEQSTVKKKRVLHFSLSRKGIALLVAICIVASTAFGFGGSLLANNLSSGSSNFGQGSSTNQLQITNTGTTLEVATGSKLTIKEIAALNANSVVEIKTESVVTDSWMQQYVTEGAGSGVIISSDGYIVTNNHVIDGAKKITVTLKSGKSYTATMEGTDSQTDIAVLKIEATGLTPVVYGDSGALEVGDLSVVIGNPLGSLGGTVTTGIVSALDRSITIDGKTMKLLQTDASINPGNSGGGMFNQNGELVGIIVAKSSGSGIEGLGFAIPVNEVKKIAQELADYGYVRGRIDTGLTLVDLTSMKNAIYYGVRSLGIYVKSVDSENAKTAGFKSGDLIYYVGDDKIDSASDLTSAFENYAVGDTVKVTVVRDNEMKTLKLVLGEKTSN